MNLIVVGGLADEGGGNVIIDDDEDGSLGFLPGWFAVAGFVSGSPCLTCFLK